MAPPRQTPDTFSFEVRYHAVTLVWDHRAWPGQGFSVTVAFHGPGGTVELDGRGSRMADESGVIKRNWKVRIPSAAFKAEHSKTRLGSTWPTFSTV